MGEAADEKPDRGRALHDGEPTLDAPPSRPPPAPHRSDRPRGARALIGTTISDRYRIQKLLGEGGMGAVYQAEHVLMRKRMAIKVLHPEMTRLPEVVARFEREAMAAAHIEHPNVVTATDFGKLEDGAFFLALEFVEGKSLREIVAQGRLDLGRSLHVGRQIAAALHRAHSLKIVHRDLKPENVMLVERDGDPDFVKVLDFGIAKVQIGELSGDGSGPGQPVLTQAGMVYGTPEYMAPEQALGQDVDHRADLYALGVILYEMLTGVRPFDAESKVALLGMQVTAPVPKLATKCPDANVPPEVEALVMRLLAKEASDRLGDAREVIEGISAIMAQLSASGSIDTRYAMPPNSGGLLSSPGLINTGPAVLPPIVVNAPPPAPPSAPMFETPDPARLATRPEGPLGNRAWLLAAGAGTLGILVLVIVLVTVMRGSSAKTDGASDAEATASADAAAPAETPIDKRVKDAVAMIDRGDYGSGIKALEEMSDDIRGREEVHRALLTAYAATERSPEAMREAGLILKANPTLDLTREVKMRVEIRDTALKEGAKDAALKEAVDEAYSLLETRMGTVGWDDLYDIAYGASGSNYPAASKRAKTELARGDRAKMSPGLAVAVDLHAASTTNNCIAIKGLLERASNNGDERALALMKQLAAPRVVGHWRKQDMLGCIHEGSLKQASATLEEHIRAATKRK